MEQFPPSEATILHSEVRHNKVSDLLAAARDTSLLDRETALYLGMQAPLLELLGVATEVRARGKRPAVS